MSPVDQCLTLRLGGSASLGANADGTEETGEETPRRTHEEPRGALPARVQEALGELAGAAQERLLALSVRR